MKIKAVIFDLDGVLADSEPLSAEADDIVMKKHGITMDDTEKRNAFGRRVEDIYNDVLDSRGAKLNVEKLVKEKDAVFNKLLKGNLKAIEGSLDLVSFLRDNGFMIALATSSHKDKMEPELKELKIDDLIKIRVTGEEVKKGKPDPEIFLAAAEKLGLNPEECSVIEDSTFGVKAAKNAGMFAIGFISPNSIDQDLSEADLSVSQLSQIKDYFSRSSLKN